MVKITGGELIKRILVNEGVKYVFGVPGDQLYPLLDAFYNDDKIKFITFHHEAAAAHAADGYARITNMPGVVIATVGPGAANLIGGVYPAFAEGIPMIIITAQNQSWKSYPDHGSMQALDQINLLKPITKWNAYISHWNRIPELLQWAFRKALTGRPGPVHLDVAVDVLYQTGDENDVYLLKPENYRSIRGPAGDPNLIDEAARILAKAKMPLIHLGGGVLRSNATEEAIKLIDYLKAIVTTSIGGRGSIPEDYPSLLLPSLPGALAAQSEADVALIAGSRLGDLDYWGKPPAWGDFRQQKTIHIDITGDDIGLNRPVDIGIVGDLKVVLSQLLDAVKKYTSPKKEYPEKLAEYKKSEIEYLKGMEDLSYSNSIPIHPLRVVREVREFFPKDSISVIDGGNTTVWASYLNKIYVPRTYLSSASGDSGHLGSGISYGIAAKLANPDKQVYVITGDGAFGFHIAELETVCRENLKITFIVLNDSSWGMIKSGQTLYYSKRYVGVEFSDIRYDLIAEAMGCHGEYVTRPEEIRKALERSISYEKSSVINVVIDKNAIPPHFEILAGIWLEGVEIPS
ncbi:thiamine pyrophosphate-dependent enzyme, possible carboligase or decarboxylase [Caldisphaera lagunensis DSM 15908]|uniref:2-oxoacid oxidoreductase (ferredoxin) n=1 Tax=Caldisphaera lagunensis (strain DSM 15908 / JCM 11604 / ANMR 0165 / IC-154) TaxID=1056495 RepID=L0ABS2_CALLD|nr:thiamine pyrophosphate-binding protein [Caldisphaera lagunensis]AFZ70577.1 thiamine pyrophosphate-dependent enzyme, possible carboligase or decarboxylase [Caldisphaera lagunensis DSM 15908]